MKKSMINVAYEVVRDSKASMKFSDILLAIGEILDMSEEELLKKASQLYTNLLRDGRFVNLGDNVWDLRENQKYDKVHIDMNEVYNDEEGEGADSEENEEKEPEITEEDRYDMGSDETGDSDDDITSGFSIRDDDSLDKEEE